MKKITTCRYCGHWLAQDKGICATCGRNQNRVFNFFSQPALVAWVTIIGVVVACLSMMEARKERMKAQTAAEIATNAMAKVEILKAMLQGNTTRLMNRQETIPFCFFRQQDGRFASFRENVDLSSYRRMTDLLTQCEYARLPLKITDNNVDQFFVDLLEVSIFEWFSQMYGPHWIRLDPYRVSSFPFGGGGGGGGWPKANTNDVSYLSATEIIDLLNGNIIIDAGGGRPFLGPIALPRGTKVDVKRINKNHYDSNGKISMCQHDRIITFKNNHIQMEIFIYNAGYGMIQPEIIKYFKMETMLDPSKNWQMQNINVRITITYNQDYILSTETTSQRVWLEQLLTLYRLDYDWNVIWPDIKASF